MTAQILHGNNLDILPTLADCSVDSIVTDPPYELGFMGKQWDATGIAYNVDLWRECLRVLKPGGHLLAFGGTRTYHRMAVAIEDAGFEIRDSIHWIYGSGFPKSLDVSKAIDKAAGAEREVVGTKTAGIANKDEGPRHTIGAGKAVEVPVTAPATDAARQWEGWGTALKPAHEPIVLARKPLIGTVANNVLTHGTGALNIDACRVANTGQPIAQVTGKGILGGTSDGYDRPWKNDPAAVAARQERANAAIEKANSIGRWPANVIHDGSDDVVERFPTQTSGANPTRRTGLGYHGANGQTDTNPQRGTETGSAARFFAATPYTDLDGDSFIYCPKPGRKERNAGLEGLPEKHSDFGGRGKPGAGFNEITHGKAPEPTANFHPTVKPLALMRYLIRLVTPPGGTVLEPFAGSGTTLAAATLEGFDSIGIELTADYLPIIQARIAWAEQQTENQAPQLFST